MGWAKLKGSYCFIWPMLNWYGISPENQIADNDIYGADDDSYIHSKVKVADNITMYSLHVYGIMIWLSLVASFKINLMYVKFIPKCVTSFWLQTN
jgi:hypothetical protein